MTTSQEAPARRGMPAWLKKTISIFVLVVALVITYFILAAFLPRWWAQYVGGLVTGSMRQGTMWGLVFGFGCTFVPLLLYWLGFRLRKRRWLLFPLLALGLAAAIPNLLTLSVVFGGGSAAHAGERVMDVDAPGFRGASLVGAVAGAVLAVAVVAVGVLYRRRGRQVKALRAERRPGGEA